MQTSLDLFRQTRQRFPSLVEAADRIHLSRGFDPVDELDVIWFEHLARAINDMMDGGSCTDWQPFIDFIATAFETGTDDVKSCIDSALVENLFFKISSVRAQPYWDRMPGVLQQLYLRFHSLEPTACLPGKPHHSARSAN